MNSRRSATTNIMFATPSFASGFARGLDLFGQFDTYNWLDDEDAIANDWLVVGRDMEEAFAQAQES